MRRPSDHWLVIGYTLIVTVGLVVLVYLQREQAGQITNVERRVESIEKTVKPTLENACLIFARVERKPRPCRETGGGDASGPPSGGGRPGPAPGPPTEVEPEPPGPSPAPLPDPPPEVNLPELELPDLPLP